MALKGFKKAQFVDGRLLLFGEEGVFGFMWMPLGTLIIFEWVHGQDRLPTFAVDHSGPTAQSDSDSQPPPPAQPPSA